MCNDFSLLLYFPTYSLHYNLYEDKILCIPCSRLHRQRPAQCFAYCRTPEIMNEPVTWPWWLYAESNRALRRKILLSVFGLFATVDQPERGRKHFLSLSPFHVEFLKLLLPTVSPITTSAISQTPLSFREENLFGCMFLRTPRGVLKMERNLSGMKGWGLKLGRVEQKNLHLFVHWLEREKTGLPKTEEGPSKGRLYEWQGRACHCEQGPERTSDRMVRGCRGGWTSRGAVLASLDRDQWKEMEPPDFR